MSETPFTAGDRPKADVIRRRVRRETVIPLPSSPERGEPQSPQLLAQRFALALAAIILVGAFLLATPWTTESDDGTPFVDALFTAVSAAAVTGLVTVDTATHWNLLGEIVILVLIQIGGLGFMVGASIVLQLLRRGSRRLRDELIVREGSPSLSLREAVTLSRRIVVFTFAVELVGAVVLTLYFWRDMPFGRALWHGVFHAVSAFCNAGFDLQGGFASLVAYQASPVVNIVVILLVQAGSLSYIALEDAATCRRWSRLSLDTKLVLLGNAVLIVGGTVAFLLLEWKGTLDGATGIGRPLASVFQSVSGRTAGFATVNFAETQTATQFLWIGIMLIGGASGSTAGGIKLGTISVVVSAVLSTLRGQEEPQVFGRRVPTPLVLRALAVIAIMMTVHFAATIALAITEDLIGGREFGFLTIMFEAMSALATVGLSSGITPSLSTAGKIVLCLTMFFGRLGPLTAAYALQRRQHPARYRFPVGTIRIG